jgi:hypothetical protein
MDTGFTFTGQSDPQQMTYFWDWCYMHGKAESLISSIQDAYDWEWSAPDLFKASGSKPDKPGEYEGLLYGQKVIMVLAFKRWPDTLEGRGTLASDEEGLKHCRDIQAWR